MTLSEFREYYQGVIIGNCGYSLADATQRIVEGGADIAAFGRPFISNPDLVERFENGWPLAPYDGSRPANYACWWDNRALPKLNTDNPAVRDYLFHIAEWWIRESRICGYRSQRSKQS